MIKEIVECDNCGEIWGDEVYWLLCPMCASCNNTDKKIVSLECLEGKQGKVTLTLFEDNNIERGEFILTASEVKEAVIKYSDNGYKITGENNREFYMTNGDIDITFQVEEYYEDSFEDVVRVFIGEDDDN